MLNHLFFLVFFCFFFSKVRVGAKEGGSHYWEMAVAITCGYGGYLLPLLAAHSSLFLKFIQPRFLFLPPSEATTEYVFRADSRLASSQWETALLCNDVSHWLGASLESALCVACMMLMCHSSCFLSQLSNNQDDNLVVITGTMKLIPAHLVKLFKNCVYVDDIYRYPIFK